MKKKVQILLSIRSPGWLYVIWIAGSA